MAANFTIIAHPNSENLHLKLMGDFDGSSAMELVHALRDNIDRYRKIFVHTCGLTCLDPFGEAVFHKNCPAGGRAASGLVFTGDYGRKLSSEVPQPAPDVPLPAPGVRAAY